MNIRLSVAETLLIIIIGFILGMTTCTKFIDVKTYQKKTDMNEGEQNET